MGHLVISGSLATIHTKDGVSSPIAQIYGSPEYKAVMRKNVTSTDTKDSFLCRMITPTLNRLPYSFTSSVDICRHADVVSVKTLLAVLSGAVESHLGTNFCFAAIVQDDYSEGKPMVINDALHALGLTRILENIKAATSEVYAHMSNILPKYGEHETWIALVVGYSSGWFDVSLYEVEGSVLESLRESMNFVRTGEENQLSAFRKILQRVVDGQKRIDRVFVYGDDAKNEAVHSFLETILDADLARNARISESIYDSSISVAKSAHEYMNTVEFEMGPKGASSSFGCQWRSKLYHEDRTEL